MASSIQYQTSNIEGWQKGLEVRRGEGKALLTYNLISIPIPIPIAIPINAARTY